LSQWGCEIRDGEVLHKISLELNDQWVILFGGKVKIEYLPLPPWGACGYITSLSEDIRDIIQVEPESKDEMDFEPSP
jgi:hypothetical protein